MRESTLSAMRRIATRRGGRCLSQQYLDSRTPLSWSCSRGHRWKAAPTNVRKGSWCPECAHRKRLTLRGMQALAKGRRGECLSDRYVNNRTKLRWRCASGHEWEAAPGLVKLGRWCPQCARVMSLSLNALTEIAASQGGRCISTEYRNVKTRLSWKCKDGHQWTATPASVRSGRWCPWCAHNQRLELQTIRCLAEERRGKCLSIRYINNRHPLLWECSRGHRWRASAANVKGGTRKQGTWCPECYNLRRRFRDKDSIDGMRELARERGGACLRGLH